MCVQKTTLEIFKHFSALMGSQIHLMKCHEQPFNLVAQFNMQSAEKYKWINATSPKTEKLINLFFYISEKKFAFKGKKMYSYVLWVHGHNTNKVMDILPILDINMNKNISLKNYKEYG